MSPLHFLSVTILLITSSTNRFHSVICSGINNKSMEHKREFLLSLTGHSVNMEHLLKQYSAICPMQEDCNLVSTNISHFDRLKLTRALSECTCSCDYDCVSKHNCCPGNMHGYLPYKCIDVRIFPGGTSESYFMIGTCPPTYADNAETVEKCTSGRYASAPVTSFARNLTYRNAHCARCNGDSLVKPWQVNITCKRKPPNLFRTVLDLPNILKQYHCNTSYWLQIDERLQYRPVKCNMADKQMPGKIFHSCNITGLWHTSDEQVNWACANLDSHFYHFKNVFCYICNPSVASSFTNTTVDRCGMVGHWKNHDRVLEDLCQSQPLSVRLAPFKNVYCMLCNGRSFLKNRLEHYFIEETNKDAESSIINIKVEIKVNAMWEIFHVLNNVFGQDQYSIKNYTASKTNRVIFDHQEVKALKTLYVTACGDKQLCGLSKGSVRIPPAQIPICGNCSCREDCIDDKTCCPDLILKAQPYTCMSAEDFITIPNAAVENRRVPISTFFSVIDRCIIRNSSNLRLCEIDSREILKLTSFVPLTIDNSNLIYKNIYCYLCNHGDDGGNHIVSFNMTLYCNILIESYLFLDFQSLLNVSNTFCSSSFIPHYAGRCNSHSDRPIMFTDWRPDIETFTREASQTFTNETTTFTRCNETGYWNEDTTFIKYVCESMTESMLALPVYKYDFRTYKNFACFICNPARPLNASTSVTSSCRDNASNESVLQCTKRGFDPLWMPYKNYFCADCNLAPVHQFPPPVIPLPSGHASTVRPGETPTAAPSLKPGETPTAAPSLKPGQTPTAAPSLVPGQTPTAGTSLMPGPLPTAAWNHHIVTETSYRFLFSIRHDEWFVMESYLQSTVPSCDNGTYDQILGSCRQLYCDDGRVLENSTCHVVSEVAANIAYVLKIKLTPSHALRVSKNTSGLHVPKVCKNVLSECTENFDTSTDFMSISCNATSNSECGANNTFSIANTSYIHVVLTIEIIATHHLTKVETELINCLDKAYNIHLDENVEIAFESSPLTEVEEQNLDADDSRCEVDVFSNASRELTLSPFEISRLMVCPQVQLTRDEFKFNNETGTIFILKNDLNMTENEFRWYNSSIRICQYDQTNLTSTTQVVRYVDTSDKRLLTYYKLFSRISLILSLVGLFLTFVTYCLFPVLRTLPGKNIMILTYNLFLAQSLLDFASHVGNDKILCAVSGICLHYFWLATFCAMNVCSYHMFKIFCLKLFESHSLIFHRKQFFIYLAYVHGAPLAAITFTIAVHMAMTRGTFTGYGYGKCFLSDIYTLVSAFLVPATVIFVLNIAFFLAVAQKIRSTPHVGRSNEKNEFQICVKLCAIVGISWPLQVVDGMFELSILSFIATGLNGFQGVYIFLSYVCNKRVFGHYRSLVYRCKASRGTAGMSGPSASDPLPSPKTWTSSTSLSLN